MSTGASQTQKNAVIACRWAPEAKAVDNRCDLFGALPLSVCVNMAVRGWVRPVPPGRDLKEYLKGQPLVSMESRNMSDL